MKTRAELNALLDGLELAMPEVAKANPDPVDFWPVFSGMADAIEESASLGADAKAVQERIDALLARHGFSMLRIDVNEMDTGNRWTLLPSSWKRFLIRMCCIRCHYSSGRMCGTRRRTGSRCGRTFSPSWTSVFGRARAHPHFLGAIVLEQVPHPAGSIETRLVIDGQQRFTTLQVFLMAARNLCAANGASKYAARFAGLVENDEDRIESEDEKYKLLPTNSDRAAFNWCMKPLRTVRLTWH